MDDAFSGGVSTTEPFMMQVRELREARGPVQGFVNLDEGGVKVI